MNSEGEAVYYSNADSASLVRRIISFLIDLFIVYLTVGLILTTARIVVVPRDVLASTPPEEIRSQPESPEKQSAIKHFNAEKELRVNKYMQPVMVPLVIGLFITVLAYHIALRRLKGGTLGYRITRIRLVNVAGDCPSWRTLMKRFGLGIPSCLFLLLGYSACLRNPRRQAWHDQMAGTWIVRVKAQPAGPAIISYNHKMLGTFLVTYPELEPQPVGSAVHERVDVTSPQT